MKYGLIAHFKTQNIGDDIQCYAMQRFLPHLDYLIDREHLDSFYTQTGEQVAAFLGGWYLHRPLNWPPSPFLKLLPLAFHLSISDKKGLLALTYYGADWFKKFPAIGCRDEGSAEFLKNYGISAYLSGCFTLTLEPFPDVEHHGKIVAVDLPNEVVEFIKRKTNKDIFITSHSLSQIQLPQEVLDFVEEHNPKVIVPTSHYPAQPDTPHAKVRYPGNWSYRHTLVEGLLRFYQGASLVVTSRLHVALPCLALGTPILLVLDSKRINAYRFYTFMPYVNHTTPEALLSKNYLFNFNEPEVNPVGYEKFPELIKAAAKAFIDSCENDNVMPSVDVETWLDGYKKNLRLKKIIQRLVLKPKDETPLPENPDIYKYNF